MATAIKLQNVQRYVILCLAVTALALFILSKVAILSGHAGIGLNYYMNTHGARPSEGLVAGGIMLYTSYLMGMAFGGPVGLAVGL
ncbi:hypothetical protein V2P11_10095 [Parageobacillus toebii]|uniref:hypothetical protein n=1 Tax=Parageobacillus toebii TaxID=153151 RepID=UPI0035C726B2